MKYTKGPLGVELCDDGITSHTVMVPGKSVAVAWVLWHGDKNIAAGDATLFAHASEMYELLSDMVANVECGGALSESILVRAVVLLARIEEES